MTTSLTLSSPCGDSRCPHCVELNIKSWENHDNSIYIQLYYYNYVFRQWFHISEWRLWHWVWILSGGCEKSNFLDKTVTFGGQIRFVILEKYFWSTMEKLLLSDPFTHPPSPISQFSLWQIHCVIFGENIWGNKLPS